MHSSVCRNYSILPHPSKPRQLCCLGKCREQYPAFCRPDIIHGLKRLHGTRRQRRPRAATSCPPAQPLLDTTPERHSPQPAPMTPREQPRAHPHVLPPGPRGHHNWEAGRSHTPFSVSPFSASPKRGSVWGWDHGAAFPPGFGGTFPRPWPRCLSGPSGGSKQPEPKITSQGISLGETGFGHHRSSPADVHRATQRSSRSNTFPPPGAPRARSGSNSRAALSHGRDLGARASLPRSTSGRRSLAQQRVLAARLPPVLGSVLPDALLNTTLPSTSRWEAESVSRRSHSAHSFSHGAGRDTRRPERTLRRSAGRCPEG